MKKLNNVGQSFDQFHLEDGIYEEVQLASLKKTIAHQIRTLMAKENIRKTELAHRMGTSRSALERLLSDQPCNVALNTINNAAFVFDKTVTISLVDRPQNAQTTQR